MSATEQDVVAEHPVPPGRWRFPRTRRYLSGFTPAGLAGALAFYCLSLTPSLLPRAWYLQAVMSAVTAAIGYAVGLLAGWLLRSLIPGRPGPGVRRAGRWALAVAAVVLIPLLASSAPGGSTRSGTWWRPPSPARRTTSWSSW
jgi:uncharacterized membrane protein